MASVQAVRIRIRPVEIAAARVVAHLPDEMDETWQATGMLAVPVADLWALKQALEG